MITVALIDDHLIVRSGFAQLLGLEPDLQVVAEFGSGSEALAGLPGRGVQVCICDISMPDISGLELLSQLPKGMAIIMLSVHDSPALVEQALNAGARGFLSKRCSPDELIAAVHTVATGGCYLTPDIAVARIRSPNANVRWRKNWHKVWRSKRLLLNWVCRRKRCTCIAPT